MINTFFFKSPVKFMMINMTSVYESQIGRLQGLVSRSPI